MGWRARRWSTFLSPSSPRKRSVKARVWALPSSMASSPTMGVPLRCRVRPERAPPSPSICPVSTTPRWKDCARSGRRSRRDHRNSGFRWGNWPEPIAPPAPLDGGDCGRRDRAVHGPEPSQTTGTTPQISRAYSVIVRSLENFPTRATFKMLLRHHRGASVYS